MTGTSAVEHPFASIGILGGTFNPPHLGHLALARQARRELGLERVLLMPARIAPHKRGEQDPGAGHRLRMCRLAAEDEPGVGVCALEVERDGPSYTVDTLRAIHARHPEAELTFIAGADTARTLGAWREPAEVLELARLAVAARVGSAREDVLETVRSLNARAGEECAPGVPAVRFLEMPVVEISSSLVRERAARGEALIDQVGAPVAGYIAERGLYVASVGVGG